MSGQSFNKVDLPPWLTVIIRATINVPIVYLSLRICARNLWRRSHWIWTHTPVETRHNHWPLRGWVVVRRRGEGGEQPQAKYTGSAQVNKTREKPPEIYSAQIWQVFHNWNDWTWLYGDEQSLPRTACVTPLFAVLRLKHTLSSASEAFSFASAFVNFCRPSASFMWYFSASLRRMFSLNTEREASSSCLKSLQRKQMNH